MQAIRHEIDRLASLGACSLDDLYEVLSPTEYRRAYIIADYAEGWGAPSDDVLAEINRRWEATRNEEVGDLEVYSWDIICDLGPNRNAA